MWTTDVQLRLRPLRRHHLKPPTSQSSPWDALRQFHRLPSSDSQSRSSATNVNGREPVSKEDSAVIFDTQANVPNSQSVPSPKCVTQTSSFGTAATATFGSSTANGQPRPTLKQPGASQRQTKWCKASEPTSTLARLPSLMPVGIDTRSMMDLSWDWIWSHKSLHECTSNYVCIYQ